MDKTVQETVSGACIIPCEILQLSHSSRESHSRKGPACTAIGDLRYSMCLLALKGLPAEIYETIIMVDAPTGYYDKAPGRMTAIYSAGMMARNREQGGETDVFAHDVNREIEDKFSKAFLCEGYMKKQEGRLRHFVIPSYRDESQSESNRPFCP